MPLALYVLSTYSFLMMLINGLRVLSMSDSAYSVSDTRGVLGGIVRHWVPAADGTGLVRRFRSIGGVDTATLNAAVAEFLKIRQVRPFDAKGDAP